MLFYFSVCTQTEFAVQDRATQTVEITESSTQTEDDTQNQSTSTDVGEILQELLDMEAEANPPASMQQLQPVPMNVQPGDQMHDNVNVIFNPQNDQVLQDVQQLLPGQQIQLQPGQQLLWPATTADGQQDIRLYHIVNVPNGPHGLSVNVDNNTLF